MKRNFLIFLSLIFLRITLLAQNIPPQLASIADTQYTGYNIVTLFDSTFVSVEESGLSHIYNHTLYKILTPAGGRDFNTITIDYDPLTAYAEIRSVKIYRKNGTCTELDHRVMDYPAPAHMIYWGARQKLMTLGRLEPGDAVEFYTYKKGFSYALLHHKESDENYIPPMRGHFYDIVPFWSKQPIQEKVYQVDIATNKNMKYAVFNGTLQTKQENTADRTLYTFVKQNIMPLSLPSYTVAHNDIETKLLLSTAQNWEAKSTWFYNVNENYGSFIPTDEVKAKVAELLKKAKNENDSISILTHWVADNMRYSGISMGKGEGFTLHTCDMNFTDRCGVCKDKAGLLIAMLRAAGFNAYAAMTMAGERIEDIPADQFNHCVAIVQRRNGNYQLLDPTWVPGVRELWSSAEQQQHYLMGLPQGATLGITPISKAENHYLRMNAHTKLHKNGSLSGTITITAEGQSDRAVRALFKGRHADWKANVEQQLFSLYPNATLKAVKYSDERTYLQHPVKISYTFVIPNYATVTNNVIIVTPILAKGFFHFAMPQLSYDLSLEKRDYPFYDRCSRLVQISETMTIPTGYTSITMPKTRTINDKHISFVGGYKIIGSTLQFNQKIHLGKRIYEASDWQNYRQAALNQQFYINTPIILSK